MQNDEIEIFLQGEGIQDIVLVRIGRAGTVQNIIEVAQLHGLSPSTTDEVFVLIEDTETPLALEQTLEIVGIRHRSRVHVHRCRQVTVTVNFNGDHKTHSFPPSTTMARVKQWVVSKDGFNLTEIDATEHLLQICGSSGRPDEDIHIGALVTASMCEICFDLIAKQRVEG